MTTKIKYAVLNYLNSKNFGDEIQSIAARNCMPHVDTVIARENLKTFSSPTKHVLLINGWFSHNPQNEFPPSPDIIPIYYSFHITPNSSDFFTTPKCIEHFKKWQPIGCRDRATKRLLRGVGIDAFYSKCLTLTFPRRNVVPTNGKTFLVDVPGNYKRFDNVVKVTHDHNQDAMGEIWKSAQAQYLLDIYREEADLIVTSKLHCALPCQAMGIPVIFVRHNIADEYRTSIYSDLGGVIYRSAYQEIYQCILESRYSKLRRVLQDCNFADFLSSRRWQAKILDVSKDAERIKRDINNIFSKKFF